MPKVETPSYDAAVLAETLRSFRRHFALNQNEMSERIGISKSLYAKLELGLAQTSVRTIRRMAEAIGTTPDYLMRKEGDEFVTAAPAPSPAAAVPSEEMLCGAFELARRQDVQALARQAAETLRLSLDMALAMIVRALLLEQHP